MITVVVGKEIEKIKGDFESYLNGLNMVGEISYSQYSELYDEGTKQIQKAYELGKSELEEKISVLLSCKNCPDNKGGYICQKEYEDKCLAQKIQYIKELKEENTELKEELKDANEKVVHLACNQNKDLKRKLTKAIEILKKYHNECPAKYSFEDIDAMVEQFLKECE